MQRLSDIVARDLSFIMKEYRDCTRSTVLQCGNYKATVMASLQSDDCEFSADTDPKNAFSLTIYYIESDTSADFGKCLQKQAIIYVDGTAFKIIDATNTMGLRVLSLQRKGGR